MNPRTVITDWGQPLVGTDDQGGEAFTIPRYGVWLWVTSKARHECIDTGDDLEALRARYGQDLEVVPIRLPPPRGWRP